MTRTTVGCLLWLTEENYERKIERFNKSITSMNKIESQDCDLLMLNNGGLENLDEIVQGLGLTRHRYVRLHRNFYDVAVHFCTMFHALESNNEFMVYLYDDFVVYDDTFITDCELFMDDNPAVMCMRLPEYEANNHLYNTKFTPKIKNPEAVRHEDGAGGIRLFHDGSYSVGKHSFFKTNWRPNSRPMLWRTKAFELLTSGLDMIPVMQPFERYMYQRADELAMNDEWLSSFLDEGMCHTFPQETSERINVGFGCWESVFVNKDEIKEAFDDARR
jgi:hypothetical protein